MDKTMLFFEILKINDPLPLPYNLKVKNDES